MPVRELWSLFWAFLKIGTCTFGGGYAMIPAIRHEFVEVRGSITEEEMMNYLALCQSVPGAIAINAALFIGNKVKGFAGAAAAALGMVFPAFISILLICVFLSQTPENHWIAGALKGVTAASVALIVSTALEQGKKTLKGWHSWVLMALSFVLIVFLKLNAVWAVLLGAAVGAVSWGLRKRGDSKI